MSAVFPSSRYAAVMFAALAGAACTRGRDAAGDSALSRDLTLAATPEPSRSPLADTALGAHPLPPASAPAARATPARVAATPNTVAPAPKPAPVDSAPPHHDSATVTASAAAIGPAPSTHTLATGTTMALATTGPICNTSNHAGDRFVASLKEPVTASDGTVLAAGTDVILELASVIIGPQNHGRVEFIARGISIDGFIRPIDAEVGWVDAMLDKRRVANPAGGSDAGKVGRGAMTGAVLGRVFGGKGGKGTVIGAAAGAAAGAASARASASFEACLAPGAPVRMRLTGPLTIGS